MILLFSNSSLSSMNELLQLGDIQNVDGGFIHRDGYLLQEMVTAIADSSI